MNLDRATILSAKDIRREPLDVPEWGGTLYVRVMTGSERDEFERIVLNGKTAGPGMSNLRARMAAITICDESGQRMFVDADMIELGKKSATALDRVFAKAQEINRIGAEEVESAEKN